MTDWHKPRIDISVITRDRPNSLARLLNSLSAARYFGDSIDLRLNVEQDCDFETLRISQGYMWRHGSFFLHHRIVHGGLLPAVVESWYPRNNDTYGLLLEDDVELSPLFYAWVKMAILKYRFVHFLWLIFVILSLPMLAVDMTPQSTNHLTSSGSVYTSKSTSNYAPKAGSHSTPGLYSPHKVFRSHQPPTSLKYLVAGVQSTSQNTGASSTTTSSFASLKSGSPWTTPSSLTSDPTTGSAPGKNSSSSWRTSRAT